MFAARPHLLPYDLLLGLSEFLRSRASDLSPSEAASIAIKEWIAAQSKAGASSPQLVEAMPPSPAQGYQWKSLFLPNGSELRMHYAGAFHYARVVGDDIVYAGQRVSPRQMTLAIAGDGRNAWRELWLRPPGEPKWKLASARRREIERQGAPQELTPFEAMSAAAACMSDTLKSALALVDHARSRACERRIDRHRRAADTLQDD